MPGQECKVLKVQTMVTLCRCKRMLSVSESGAVLKTPALGPHVTVQVRN